MVILKKNLLVTKPNQHFIGVVEMKRYRVRYRDNYFATEDKYMVIIAETVEDVYNFFFANCSGIIFEAGFIGWV